MAAVEQASQGIGNRLARWSQRLLARDEEDDVAAPAVVQPAREKGNERLRREIERRKALFADVGEFLFAHDLDLTPLNFGLAIDYITGNDLSIEKAVRAVLSEKGKLTNGVAETIVAGKSSEELSSDAMAAMMSKVEASLQELSGIAGQSSTSAKDYSEALQKEAKALAGADSGAALSNLLEMTRHMVERTREVEAKMKEGQKKTKMLQKNLEQARKAAELDHLTGLPNRRSFENTMREEVALAQQNSEPLAVAFCDIDHFKMVNDTHGHDTGDRVLKFVGSLLSKISGERCHVARHGGEEFVMLIRGKTLADAAKLVDDAREDMSERNLVNSKTGERMEQVTFSGGVADVFAYPDPREALKAADRALYLAKENGRNRVYLARDDEGDA
jgi:diguanylate cyclase